MRPRPQNMIVGLGGGPAIATTIVAIDDLGKLVGEHVVASTSSATAPLALAEPVEAKRSSITHARIILL
ncbi:hypothetical protein [Candidatus Oscillochloris fontis]|uniref:hypothetical protein n=1 Tax=Candidatus Oscillochloris fontis TaxID=2496868 RepID=UPI00101D9D82|nr:hypothetical protein [Candidatus Oscillochloris fontis]